MTMAHDGHQVLVSEVSGGAAADTASVDRVYLRPDLNDPDVLEAPLALTRFGAVRDHATYFGSIAAPRFGKHAGSEGAVTLDWWESRPTTPAVVGQPADTQVRPSDGFVLAADQAVYFRAYLGEPYGWLQLRSSAETPEPTATNHGLIVSSQDSQHPASAIGTATSGPTTEFGHTTWRNTGRIYSDSWRDGEAVVDSNTIGAYFAANTTFINSGLMQSTGDRATGFTGVTSLSVTNEASGVIRVWGDSCPTGQLHHTLGGYLGGTLTNAGLIEASSRNQDDTIGIWGAFTVNNTGTIRTHADPGQYAVTLYECLRVVNSGLIEGSVAVWAGEGTSYTVTNSGEIIGDIYGNGTITNTGVIEGDLYFYDQDTVYDGRGGELWGSIFLGTGANVVHLGDNGGFIYGWTSGTNTLNGGTGDDVFDLMGGTSTIAAGAGYDLISYLRAETGLTANLLTGTARNGSHTFSGVEALIGSAFADVLTGLGAGSSLNGAGGNDRLEGGGGNDRLVGGTGDDVLVSRGGSDVLIGGFGSDAAQFDGLRSDYAIATLNGVTTVSRAGHAVTLTGVESLVFADQTVQIAAPLPVTGTVAGESLSGGDGDDQLLGLGGDDILNGGLGSDILDGGDGMDTAFFSGLRSQYTLDLTAGTVSSLEHTSQLIGIERLRFGDQTLILSPNGGMVLTGQAFSETLIGTDRNDEIEAGGGNDTVDGLAGDDLLSGQDGNDRLTGGIGLDRLSGGFGDDYLSGGSGDVLNGDEGNDILLVTGTRHETAAVQLFGGTGSDTAILRGPDATVDLALGEGTVGSTQLRFNGVENVQIEGAPDAIYPLMRRVLGDGAANQLTVGGLGVSERVQVWFDGRDGDDFLAGGSGDDFLFGGLGLDRLDGGGGIDQLTGDIGDTINGGAGDDVLTVLASTSLTSSTFDGGAGDDVLTLRGASASLDLALGGGELDNGDFSVTDIETILIDVTGSGRQRLSGDAGDNRFGLSLGASGAVHLEGRDGNDVLFGGAGSDLLDGGSGIDTAHFGNQINAHLTIRLDLGTVTATDGTVDILVSIENVHGSGNNDTIYGTAGANVIWGASGVDVLFGLGGNDVLYGGTFYANTMSGGEGDDTYIVEHENDVLIEAAGEGIDTVETAQMFRLSANIENLTYTGFNNFRGEGNDIANVIRGGNKRDNLFGNGGDDTLIGGAGITNELSGGAGNDRYILEVADTIFEDAIGGGIDTVETAVLTSYTLPAEVENLVYVGVAAFDGTGNAAANLMVGGAGADVLRGEGGDDILSGGLGDDTLTGGLGNDVIDGGSGHDVLTVSGVASGYRLLMNGDDFILKGPDGTDRLAGVENIRFADGRVLELNRMYGPDVDTRAWADGRIPEALLSGGDWSGDRPLVLPGPADDDGLVVKGDGGPEVLPASDDTDGWIWKDSDAPLVLPGAPDLFVANAKGGDAFEVLPGVDERSLFAFEPVVRPEPWSGQMLIIDEQGRIVDQYGQGGWSPDGWSF